MRPFFMHKIMTSPLPQIAQEWQIADAHLPDICPAISIFGSARLPTTAPEYALAERVARRLSDAGFAVLSGGGPSIMEAANKGAYAGKSAAVGLNLTLPHEQHANPYQDLSLQFQYFASRKSAFVRYSQAFIVFAGGFGTLDELFDTLAQVQTRKVPAKPIILVGSAFWQGLLDWLNAQLAARGLIRAEDLDLLTLLDDEDEIVATVLAGVEAA